MRGRVFIDGFLTVTQFTVRYHITAGNKSERDFAASASEKGDVKGQTTRPVNLVGQMSGRTAEGRPGLADVVKSVRGVRGNMKASIFYRIAAVLLLLFAVGHTLGFRQSDPSWGVDSLLGSMRSIHFDVQGFSRTYWDLFVAAGLCVGVFYFFSAILAWQLGGLPAETLARLRGTRWAFAACFAAITVVSWRYLFILPIVFSLVITACLIAAAWLSPKAI
jgi:hypothetical protein